MQWGDEGGGAAYAWVTERVLLSMAIHGPTKGRPRLVVKRDVERIFRFRSRVLGERNGFGPVFDSRTNARSSAS